MRCEDAFTMSRRARACAVLMLFLIATSCTGGDDPMRGSEGSSGVGKENSSPSEEQVDIYVMSADGRGMKRLTRHPLTDGTPVVWSPRGDRIMYGRGVEGHSGTYVMDRDGSDPIELIPPQGGSVAGSWGFDGTVVLSSNRSGSNLLYTMKDDGTGLRPIPNSEEGDYFPVASPDGGTIAFMSEDGPESDIWMMGTDGSNRVPLAVAPLAQKWTTWSPDGTRLAYHDLPSQTIRVVDIDSGESRELKLDRPALMPAWSPNGLEMAFISSGDVCVARLASRHSVCFDRPGQAYGPAWSPNGRLIAFAYVRE